MENKAATKYAYELAKALGRGNYESFNGRTIMNETADGVIVPSEALTLQSVNTLPSVNVMPSQNQAPTTINQTYQSVPGMLPIGTYTGEIAFRVVRATSNINAPLPIPFGSAFAFSQNYLQVLEALCPAGVNVSNVQLNVDTNNLVITYTNGVSSDVVTINGDTYNYITFNQGLYTRKALTNIIRFTVPDNSNVYNQVSSTPSRPFKSSWLSNSQIDRNTLTLTPMQFNKNVFDILAQVELSEEKGFGLYAFPDVANPLVSLSYGVQMFFSVIGKI